MPDSGEAFYSFARGAGLAFTLLLALGLERWRPHERGLRPAWGTNGGLWAIDALVMALLCGACGWTVAAWAGDRGLGLLRWGGAGAGVSIAAGVFGLDAVSYAWHRANHRIPLFWRFHQVHHADASFHATTALRFHPGELGMALPVRLAAVLVLGVSPPGVLVFELLFGAANLLVHGNFDLPRAFDPHVQRVLVTPSLHRAHHTADWRELDTNFGTIFSFWDRLFGTFQTGDPARRIVTGLPGSAGASSPGLVQSLLLPVATTRRRTANG
jgi:sterol desaturase/sphingolipid hydroxylase (fatty acid hydroxylase superfamily)